MKVDNFNAKEIMLRAVLNELRALPRVGEKIEARVLAFVSAQKLPVEAKADAPTARFRTSGGLVFTARLDSAVKLTQGETVSMTVAEAGDGYILLKLNETPERPAVIQLLLGGESETIYEAAPEPTTPAAIYYYNDAPSARPPETEDRSAAYAAARSALNTPAPDIKSPETAPPQNVAGDYDAGNSFSENLPVRHLSAPAEGYDAFAPREREAVQQREAPAAPPPAVFSASVSTQRNTSETDAPETSDIAPPAVVTENTPDAPEHASTKSENEPARADTAARVLPGGGSDAKTERPEHAASAPKSQETRADAALPDAHPNAAVKTTPRPQNDIKTPAPATDDIKPEPTRISDPGKHTPPPKSAAEVRDTDARRAPEADLAPRQRDDNQPQAAFAHARIPVSIHGERRDADIYIKRGKKKRDTATPADDMLLTLDLPALGRWEALMSVSGRDVSIRMKAADDGVRALLASNTARLAEILSEAGYRLTQTRVSVRGGDARAAVAAPDEGRARYIDLSV